MKPDYEILPFKDSKQWRRWLEINHDTTDGVWIKIYKKATGIETIDHTGALDDALCYGWIDGQRKGNDEESFLQKFTPRRKASLWSKRNIEHIERLTAAGLMTPAGQDEVDRAKADGRWDRAYDAPSEMTIPEDFLEELKKYPRATKYFATLNKTNCFAIGWRLQTAKKEDTRKRRMGKIIEMLNDNYFR